jgi:hypothetical protein
MKSSEDTVRKGTSKEYLIAQDFMLRGTHYYRVEADTMGAAIFLIESVENIMPEHSETHEVTITGYTDSEDNYDS